MRFILPTVETMVHVFSAWGDLGIDNETINFLKIVPDIINTANFIL